MIFFDLKSQEDTERYLYHYTSVENALIYILPQKRLRFSPLNKTNDPQEASAHYFSLRTPEDERIAGSEEELNKLTDLIFSDEFSDLLRKNIRVLCFSQDVLPQCYDFFDFGEYTGRGFAKPRMWAQYSERSVNGGVCLVLDKKKLIERFDERFNCFFHQKGEIHYGIQDCNRAKCYLEAYQFIASSQLFYNIFSELENRKQQYSEFYYFYKHNDWKDESEYRLLVESHQDEYIELDGILDTIILGAQTPDSVKNPIEKIIEIYAKKPSLSKLSCFNRHFSLIPV